MELIKIEALPREIGRAASRAARRAEEVPCVLYGSELEAQVFKVPELSLRPLIFTNEFHRVELTVAGKQYECILKEIQWDPVSDRPIHADFQTLVEGHMMTLTVPIHFMGNAVGVQDGGTPQVFMNEISVRCLPKDIPDHIEVDITALDIGDTILLRDLDLDFENITFNVPDDQALISIIQPRELVEPVVEEGEVEDVLGGESSDEDEESEGEADED